MRKKITKQEIRELNKNAGLIIKIKKKDEPRIKYKFYKTRRWLELRYDVLKEYGSVCMLCGAKPPDCVINVDHIKPVSKYPELAYDRNNLQILCASCNSGKSNRDESDFRSFDEDETIYGFLKRTYGN